MSFNPLGVCSQLQHAHPSTRFVVFRHFFKAKDLVNLIYFQFQATSKIFTLKILDYEMVVFFLELWDYVLI